MTIITCRATCKTSVLQFTRGVGYAQAEQAFKRIRITAISSCRLRPSGAGSGVKHCKQANYEIKPETAEDRERTYRRVLQ